MVDRREFLEQATRWLLLAAALPAPDVASARAGGPTADRWLARADALTLRLTRGRLGTRGWRRAMLRCTQALPVQRIRDAIDFDRRATSLAPRVDAEPQEHVTLWSGAATDDLAVSLLLSRVPAGHAVVPHGHRNMVSMHVVLEGTLRVRQYDRVANEPAHLVMRPRLDRVLRPGDATAIAADLGNVHWFHARSDAYALIVAAYDLRPADGPTVRDYVDPLAATTTGDGLLRAPRLPEEDAVRRYLRSDG